MTHDRSGDAPSHVARALTRYLDGEPYDSAAAFADVTSDLCLWLGVYVDTILRRSGMWSPWWAIDDACPRSIERGNDDAIDIRGIAGVLGDSSIGYDQPFHVTVRLAASRLGLSAATVRFGDAEVGLRDHGRRRAWPDVNAWVLEVDDDG